MTDSNAVEFNPDRVVTALNVITSYVTVSGYCPVGVVVGWPVTVGLFVFTIVGTRVDTRVDRGVGAELGRNEGILVSTGDRVGVGEGDSFRTLINGKTTQEALI